jgi:hypothetical protein
MFLATGILSKLMMIMMNCTIREDMPKCEIGHPIRLTCNRGRELRPHRCWDEHANSSNWINAEKQLEKQRSPVIPSG